MTDPTHPLRLAVGSHQAGSGKGCAMNVISWENGDTTITDLPACADRMLARVVQRVNDTICNHRDGDLLCPECSIKVLALAHRTVGTGAPPSAERRAVWVRLAREEAESVKHLLAAIPAATTAANAADAATYADIAAEYVAADNVVDAGAAAYAAASGAYAAAAYADAAANAAANAAATNAAANDAAAAHADIRLGRAHRLIDRFYQYTGLTEPDTSAEVTAVAVEKMLVKA